ncbi:hypothetical protein MVES_001433 [Malassezia vespertilionis]|uniref:SUN domain-containing protein n=1 Tax=Malassezia vespertilionis TaxID=2020962 RepID=A0A2N1JCG2_9BASI|nr:hypothetical protein MVES_001433 [Malassezia vespertilionis]
MLYIRPNISNDKLIFMHDELSGMDSLASHTRTPTARSDPSTRDRRKSDVPDASGWTSSLYSANNAHDASLVSSYYLRSQQPESALAEDASESFGLDDASTSHVFQGLGSLLRGAQRPPHTPRSSLRNGSRFSDADDYTNEDAFMDQVDTQYQARSAKAKRVHTPGKPSVMSPTKTPRIPGFFQFFNAKEKEDGEQKWSFFGNNAPPPPQPPNVGTKEGHGDVPHTTFVSSSPSFWPRLLLLLCVGAALYHLIASMSPSFPFRKRSSNPWLDASIPSDDIWRRVDAVETAMNKLWHSFGDLGTDFKQAQGKLAGRIQSLEERAALTSTVHALENDIRTLQSAQKDTIAHLVENKKQSEAVAARLAVVEQKAVSVRSRGAVANDALEAVHAKIADLEVRLSRAAHQAAMADDAAADAKRMLAPLRDFVPEHMPVRIDTRTKRLHIDPAFWQELRKVFGDAHRSVSNEKPGSWSAFLDANRGKLESLFSDALHSRLASGILLDRDSFLALMQAELARAKAELSARFNENVHGIQNEILAKVRDQQDMYERSGSWSKPHTLEDDVPSDSASVRTLIDAAIAQYAADQIARADFAQYSAGGRVIPTLTSPTHEMRMGGADVFSVSSFLRSFIPLPPLGGRSSSSYTVRGRMPVVALHHDNAPGMCWPFSGTHGQLGIQLVRKIHVEAVTVDHISNVLALDGLASAPRDMEVWGILDTEEERRQLVRWRRERQATQWQRESTQEPTPVPPSPSHVFLGSFRYDISRGAPPVQTFPITLEAASLPLAFRVVQLNVLSNHGLRDFTCVYRVRVHGAPADHS